jgi:ABC-2 type transport system permease protein
MKKLRQYLEIFYLLSKYSFVTSTQSNVSFVLFFIAKMIRFAMFFFFIYYLVANTKTLSGYSVDQALIFFVTFNIIDSISQALFREVYRFRQMVVSGELNSVLVKPYPILLRVLIGGVDPMDLLISVCYIVLAGYMIHATGAVSVFSGFVYIGLILNSLVLATAFHIAVLGFAIITTDVDHSILIYRDLTSAGRFPLEIYREPLRSFLTFVVPVGIMMSYPSQALFGTLSLLQGSIGITISLVVICVSLYFWKYSLRKYQSWGG